MNFFRVLSLTLGLLLANIHQAWAKTAEEAPNKSYTLSYLFVVFCVGLGLMIVLRPVNRSTEIKFRRDDD